MSARLLTDSDFMFLCEKINEGYSVGYALSFLPYTTYQREQLTLDPRFKALQTLQAKIPGGPRKFSYSNSVEEELHRLEELVTELNTRLLEKDSIITKLRINPDFLPALTHVN